MWILVRSHQPPAQSVRGQLDQQHKDEEFEDDESDIAVGEKGHLDAQQETDSASADQANDRRRTDVELKDVERESHVVG